MASRPESGGTEVAPRGGAQAARIRAARGYADLKQPAVAKSLGMSVETYQRVERGDRLLTADELLRVADATGVPFEFLVSGFRSATATPLDQRVASLTSQVDDLAGYVSQLEQALEGLERQRQEDLAAVASELAAQVSLALETGALPTAAGNAARANREERA